MAANRDYQHTSLLLVYNIHPLQYTLPLHNEGSVRKRTCQVAPKALWFMTLLPTALLWLLNKIKIIIISLNCKASVSCISSKYITLDIIFKCQKLTTFQNMLYCVLITYNCNGFCDIWRICYIDPSFYITSTDMFRQSTTFTMTARSTWTRFITQSSKDSSLRG